MELFPASDEDKWDLIKGVIDDSDYYCLIIGGRYGSQDDGTQLSYTQMEYEYAQETEKPTMVFMHRNPDAIPQGLTDKDPEKAAKLEAFKSKVGKARNAQFFESAHELAASVAVSMTDMVRKRPAIGWVRGDAAMTPEIRGELIELRARAAVEVNSDAVPVFPDLEDGEDIFPFRIRFGYTDIDERSFNATLECEVSWNAVFAGLAPRMLHEITENQMSLGLKTVLKAAGTQQALDDEDVETVSDVQLETRGYFGDVLVQLLALRLIERGTVRRPVSDTQRYWKLTNAGEDRMMQLRARRKGAAISNEAGTESV